MMFRQPNPASRLKVLLNLISLKLISQKFILQSGKQLSLSCGAGMILLITTSVSAQAETAPSVTKIDNNTANGAMGNRRINASIPSLGASCAVNAAERTQKANLRDSLRQDISRNVSESKPSDQTQYEALITKHRLDLTACRNRSATKLYGLRLQLPPQANAQTIAALVDDAVDQGYNQIFVEVVNAEGLVLLPAADLPRPWLPQPVDQNLTPPNQPNADKLDTPSPAANNPVSQVTPSLDLWQTVIAAGQKRGVQVHGVVSLTIDPYDPFAPSLKELLPQLIKRQPTSLIFDLQVTKPLGNGSRLQLLSKLPDARLQPLLQKFFAQGNLTADDITAVENQAPPRPLRRRSRNPILTAQLTQQAFTNLIQDHQAIGQTNLLRSLLYRPSPSDRPSSWGLWQSPQRLSPVMTGLPAADLAAPLWVYPVLDGACTWSVAPIVTSSPSSLPPVGMSQNPSVNSATNLAARNNAVNNQPDPETKCQQKLRSELSQLLKTGAITHNFHSTGLSPVVTAVRPTGVCPVIRVSGKTSLDLEQLTAPLASPSQPFQPKNIPSCVVVHFVPVATVTPPVSPESGNSSAPSGNNPLSSPTAPLTVPSNPDNWPLGRPTTKP